MRLSHVIHVAGHVLRLFGVMFLAPIVVALYYGELSDLGGFLLAGGATVVLSQVMVRASSAVDDL